MKKKCNEIVISASINIGKANYLLKKRPVIGIMSVAVVEELRFWARTSNIEQYSGKTEIFRKEFGFCGLNIVEYAVFIQP